MNVTFWGTRGSLPIPMMADEFRIKAKRLLMKARDVDLGDEAAVDAFLDSRPLPEAMTFGGNTPCLEVEYNDNRIVLDCGSGLYQLGRELAESGIGDVGRVDILQTHTHWDHMMGFPFFAPAYMKGMELHIHGVHPDLKKRFEQQMDLVHFPITMNDMAADITFHQYQPEEAFELGPFSIVSKALHHPGGSYSYRLSAGGKSMIYATDGEYKEPTDEVYQPYIRFFEGADLLVFDAMYSTLEKVIEKENFGHSTPVIGIGLALSAGVGTLVLFHHDPECNDAQIAQSFAEAKEYLDIRGRAISETPLDIVMSYDGMSMSV